MEHPQYGTANISFQIESFCYKLMKTLFCMVNPEESDEYFEEIDLENPSVINQYTPLKKRNNNINIEQIIINDYFEV